MGKQSRLKVKKKKNQQPCAPLVAFRPRTEAVDVSQAPAGKVVETRPASPQEESPKSAEVQHLRALNRQETDQDQILLEELERGAVRAAIAEQVSQEARRLTRHAEQSGYKEGMEAAGREAQRRLEERLAEIEGRWSEAMAGVEKERTAAQGEATRIKKDMGELARCKAEVENRLREREMEMDGVNRSLRDVKRALERVRVENEGFKKDLRSIGLERDEARENLDAQVAEMKALEIKISDLEKCRDEANQALERAMAESQALEENGEKTAALVEALTEEKAFLERILVESRETEDELRRQLRDEILAKAEELKKVVLERDETRDDLRLRTEETEVLVKAAQKVAEEVFRRARLQCGPPEAVAAEWKRDLELLTTASEKGTVLAGALRFLEKLSLEFVKAIQNKEELLEQIKREMEKMKSAKEEERADLARLASNLTVQLDVLGEAHKLLRAEEEDLRAQVAKLIADNDDAHKVLDNLHLQLGKQIEEDEEKTRRHQSQVDDYLNQIGDLETKLEAAVVEINAAEKEKNAKQDEIFALQESIARLNSETTVLRELCSTYVTKKERLRTEKDGALERLAEQSQKADALALELKALEKTNCGIRQELADLERTRDRLLEEKNGMELRVDGLLEETASARRSLAGAELRLEEREKVVQDSRKLAEAALATMKRAAAEAARGIQYDGGEKGAEWGEGEAAPEPEAAGAFAAEVEAVRRAVRRREAEIEGVRRELRRERQAAAGVRRANALWKWFSSAAALSTTALAWAFAAGSR